MTKFVIIINGRGGVGKDTLCEFAGRQFCVKSISAITPIKEIAAQYGWKGEKDKKSRKFLADLKQAFVSYNDLPFQYLCREYQDFLRREEELLFVHIRESSEIEKFKGYVTLPCVTLLVRRESEEKAGWGNDSDDNVDRYAYDFYYDNEKPLAGAESDFIEFLKKMLAEAMKDGTAFPV